MDTAKLPALRDRLFAPIHIAWLVFFRIAFGGIMLWEVWRYFDQGRIARYYIDPNFHFTYYGFGWVQPWNGEGMFHHFYFLGFLAICIMAGFFYRLATALFFLAFTYVFLLDQTQHLNHFYLVCLISFLLIFVPAHRAFSLDARRWPKMRTTTVPAWSLWLLRAQIAIAYFYAGIAKMGQDWLRGEPMRTWLADRMDFPLVGQYFDHEWAVNFFVYGGMLLDLLVIPGLLWKRTRPYAFAAAVSFHLFNSQLFSIGIFPWFMLCATLLFFSPDLPVRLWDRLRRKNVPNHEHDHDALAAAAAEFPARPTPSPWTFSQKLTVTLIGLYLTFQILMPLRHYLYPGNVDWTEEGHRFSWHMKLRSKDAESLFLVTDKSNGHVMEVYPQEYLNGRQVAKMSTRPDMILQFAHYLVGQMRLQGYPNVEIRAEVMASLNGRRPQLLIDPQVDLATQPRTLAHAPWIMPLVEPLPKPGEPKQHQSLSAAE